MDKDAPYPWLAIVTTLAIAFAVNSLGLIYTFGHVSDTRRQADALQQARLAQTALEIESDLRLQAQLTRVAASSISDAGSAGAIERNLRLLLAATDPLLIDGIAAYPVAGSFGSAVRVARVDRVMTEDFARKPWYTAALGTPGKPLFTGPDASPHDAPFLATSETFGPQGAPAGVVVVEASQPKLNALLAAPAGSMDHAWITDPNGATILGATPPAALTIDSFISTPLSSAPWRLLLASHFPDVDRAKSQAFNIDVTLTIVAWGGALLTIFGMVRVRKLQQRHAALEKTAVRDTLTGLYNRAHVLWRLKEALRTYAHSRKHPFSVLYVDLDRFAVVNDSLGHSVGDELLCAIANRLEESLPRGVEIGRVGGDEFVVYVPAKNEQLTCESIAETIFTQMRQPFRIGERDVYISASIGIVEASPQYSRADELLRDADLAMYAAKRAGRNRLTVFDESMREQIMERHSMENSLRRAIAAKQIYARYQPIVDLQTGRIAGVEALARWADERGKMVSPDLFIPLAEQCGAIDAIDWVILAQACTDVRTMQQSVPDLTVSVNLSATRLNQSDLAERIHQILESSRLKPSSIKLEVTESAIMESPQDSLAVLNAICAFGSQVVIDDFGTGHSSLSYVQRLPVKGLKIDRSFITPIVKDPQSLAIVQAIVALARTLNIYVVAEGVEDKAQAEKLKAAGVDFAQGFYFAPALEIRALQTFIDSHSQVAQT